ncbi:MAG: hypothetical protein AAGJ82_14105 [Bacteroidota bacterium]
MEKKAKTSPYESVLAVGFLLLMLYRFVWLHDHFLLGIIAFVLLALLSSRVADGVHWVWQKLTYAIGWVMNRVLMTVIFFVFLTPIALLYRLFRGKPEEREDTVFVERNHWYTSKDVGSPW